MAHPMKHAESSARRFGGRVEDYLQIHDWFDESKAFMADFRHRALRTMRKAFSCASTSSVSQSPTAKANKFLCATSENNMRARISGAYPLHKLSQIKPVRWMYGQRFEQDAPGPHVASCPIYSARAQAVTLASRVFMTSKIMCTTASSPIAVLIIV